MMETTKQEKKSLSMQQVKVVKGTLYVLKLETRL